MSGTSVGCVVFKDRRCVVHRDVRCPCGIFPLSTPIPRQHTGMRSVVDDHLSNTLDSTPSITIDVC